MKVSVYATANRVDFWPRWYGLMSRNSCEWEVVVCGNVRPQYALPFNMKFVYSEFKPAQCQAIAAMHCTGDLMMNGVDDWEYSAGLFDEAVATFSKSENARLCALPRIGVEWQPGLDRTHENWRLVDGAMNVPVIPQQAFFRRELYEEIQGYDVRFVASAQDQDLSMRLIRTPGYELVHMAGWSIECAWQAGHPQRPLYERVGGKERFILDELWVEGGSRPHGFGGSARLTATGPHLPYDRATIETKEQGPSIAYVTDFPPGEWPAEAARLARLGL